MVYLKSGNAITEFLAFTGAHQAALSMEEERVVKSVRNDVNRQINAELANQQKAASAAVEQIYAIRRVVEHYGMENLPPALQDFIRPVSYTHLKKYKDCRLRKSQHTAEKLINLFHHGYFKHSCKRCV